MTKRSAAVVAPERAAIVYCRVSTKVQEEEGSSLDTQAAACIHHAKALGYSVGRVTREVYTGSELWDRPLLSRDRADLKSGQFAALVCYATDRLSRDPIHLAIVAEECERAGVVLAFVTEPLDGSDEGALIRYVKGYAAKMERAKIRERTMRGKRARAASGRLLAGSKHLYGYVTDRETGTRSVNDAEAAVVRMIFEWVAAGGVSINEVIRRLNTRGIPPPSAGVFAYEDGRVPRWGNSTVLRIMREPAYKGEAYAYRWATRPRNGSPHKQVMYRDRDEWVRLPESNTPAIVTTELWEAAERRLDTNQQRGDQTRNAARPYLLRGLLWCSVCGLRMRTSPEHGRRVYRCSSRETPAGACGASRVPAEPVEAEIWTEIERILRHPKTIASEAAAQHRRGPDAQAVADLASAQRKLAKIEREQERLGARLRTADEGTLLWDLVEREVGRAERERNDLRETIRQLEGRIAAQEAAIAKVDALSAYCARVARRLKSFGFDDKRLAFDALGVRIDASGREWEMTGSINTDAGEANITR